MDLYLFVGGTNISRINKALIVFEVNQLGFPCCDLNVA